MLKRVNMNKSIIKRTTQNMVRSGWRAYAVMFMMTMTFILLSLLLALLYTSQKLANTFEQKPEVMAYFNEEVTEEQILEVKRELETQDTVFKVSYVSREQAMQSFLLENAD